MQASANSQGPARLCKATPRHKDRAFSEISGQMNVVTKSEPDLATVLKQSIYAETMTKSKGSKLRRHSVASRYASTKVESTMVLNATASAERNLNLRRKKLASGAENDSLKCVSKSKDVNANTNVRQIKPSVVPFWRSIACKPNGRMDLSKGISIGDPKESPAFLRSRAISQSLDTALSWKPSTCAPKSSTNHKKRTCPSLLSSASYWLQNVKLAEAMQQHSISLGFFRLAIECNPKPLHLLRDELLAYWKRYRLCSQTVTQILFHYDLIDKGQDSSAGKLVQRNDPDTVISALDSFICSTRDKSQLASINVSSTILPSANSFGGTIQCISETNKVQQIQSAEPCLENGESVKKASSYPFSVEEYSNHDTEIPTSSSCVSQFSLLPMSPKTSTSNVIKEQDHLGRVPNSAICPARSCAPDEAGWSSASLVGANIQLVKTMNVDSMLKEVVSGIMLSMDDSNKASRLKGSGVHSDESCSIMGHSHASSYDTAPIHKQFDFSDKEECRDFGLQGVTAPLSEENFLRSSHENIETEQEVLCDASEPSLDIWNTSPSKENMGFSEMDAAEDEAQSSDRPLLLSCESDIQFQNGESCKATYLTQQSANAKVNGQYGIKESEKSVFVKVSNVCQAYFNDITPGSQEIAPDVSEENLCSNKDATSVKKKGEIISNDSFFSEHVKSLAFQVSEKKDESDSITYETPVRAQVLCRNLKSPSSRGKSLTRMAKTSLTTPIVNGQRSGLSNCPSKVSPSNNVGSSARRNVKRGMCEDRSVKQALVEASCVTPDGRTDNASQSVGTPASVGLRRSARIRAASPAVTPRT